MTKDQLNIIARLSVAIARNITDEKKKVGLLLARAAVDELTETGNPTNNPILKAFRKMVDDPRGFELMLVYMLMVLERDTTK